MGCSKVMSREFNFSAHQSRVTNIFAALLVTSIVLTILAQYDYIPPVGGLVAQSALSIVLPCTICWMTYSCRAADQRIQKRDYEEEYRAKYVSGQTPQRQPYLQGRGHRLGGT